MKSLVLTFAGTLLLGAITGWAAMQRELPATPKQVTVGDVALAPQSSTRPLATAVSLVKASRDMMERLKQGESPYAETVSEWTTEEIRAALAECLSNRDFLLEANGARSIAMALLTEWLKRDCDAASAWFLSIDSASIKTQMIMAVSRSWPPEQAEKGLAFLIGHPEVFNGASGWAIIVKNIERRAQEGPQAVVGLLRELQEAKLGLDFENPAKFPPSFDFATLMNSAEVADLGETGSAKAFVRAWYAQDRDAAFQWLLETKGAKALMTLTRDPAGQMPEDLQWLGGKYTRLDAAQREEFRAGIEPGYTWNPDRIVKLAAGASDPAAADELRGAGTQFIYAGMTRQAIPLLAQISDPARRLEILENAAPQGSLASQPQRRRFTPADEAELRKSLAEWHATDSQTESILSKFKP